MLNIDFFLYIVQIQIVIYRELAQAVGGMRLFNWNDVPGKDKDRLIKYLRHNLTISWANRAKIKKSEDEKSIIILYKEKWVVLKIKKEEKSVTLNGDRISVEFILKEENGNLNIYEKVQLIQGPQVFRSLGGINILKLNNVGLKKLGWVISYIMRVGRDVGQALTDPKLRNAIKVVLFGSGYENRNKVSIGASIKGRIWSRKRGNIKSLIKWCSWIGKKVMDENIDPEEVLRGTLIPVVIQIRPLKMPIGIEWPEEWYEKTETTYTFEIDNKEFNLYEIDLKLVDPSNDGDLKFALHSEGVEVELRLEIDKNGFRFYFPGNEKVYIKYGRTKMVLNKYFNDTPPFIRFVDGSFLEGNFYTELKKRAEAYRRDKIDIWDWNGINIRKESQGINKDSDSIQYRVIERIFKKYDIIFDDDGPGEAADVVAIKNEKDKIAVAFYHCKFSKEDTAGKRLEDLYEVCGQAQKSIHWMERQKEIFSHLLRREEKRKEKENKSRFEKGTPDDILWIIWKTSKTLPVRLSIYIVQPGLSEKQVSSSQLELLGVTENYLMETMMIPFGVIANN